MPQPAERSVGLRLPAGLYAKYAEQSDVRQCDVETLMEERLAQAVSANDNRPIYFTDAERREIDDLFGRNVRSAEDILRGVRRSLNVRVASHSITLAPQLLERLKSRHFTDDKFEKFLEGVIIEGLERYVGLR